MVVILILDLQLILPLDLPLLQEEVFQKEEELQDLELLVKMVDQVVEQDGVDLHKVDLVEKDKVVAAVSGMTALHAAAALGPGGAALPRAADDLLDRAVVQVDAGAEGLAHALGIGVRLLTQQRMRRSHHARRAKATLQSMIILKSLLHRMPLTILRQAFNGYHFGSFCLKRKHGTGFHAIAIDMNDAGATLAGIAANMRTR